MSTNTNCPSCSKKYAGFDGEDSRKPVVFTCLCVFCKECALEEEAKAQQQHPASASGGGGKKRGKAKKKKKEVYTPTPCMSCSKPCTLPVCKLKLDVVAMKAVDVGSAQPTAVPICDNCEEEQATKFCGDCKLTIKPCAMVATHLLTNLLKSNATPPHCSRRTLRRAL